MPSTKISNGQIYFGNGQTQKSSKGLASSFVRKYNGFDGQGNGIALSYNVSSISQISTGRWQVNLSTALSDTNNAIIALTGRNNYDAFISEDIGNKNQSIYTLVMFNYSSNRYDFGFSSTVIGK